MQKRQKENILPLTELLLIYAARNEHLKKKVVPNFLVDQNLDELDKNNLLNGLKLVGDYLEKNILKPNNLNSPIPRSDFIKVLK